MTEVVRVEKYRELQKLYESQKIIIAKLQDRIQELEYKLELATVGD